MISDMVTPKDAKKNQSSREFWAFFKFLARYVSPAMAADEKPDELALLVTAARQGDRGSLDRLLRQLWPWLRRKAGFLVSRSAPLGVSSLTQETALRFSRSIVKARAADSPAVKALLHRIMRNTAVSAQRTALRVKRDPAQQLLAEVDDSMRIDVEQQLDQSARLVRLHSAGLQLPDRQRRAITLLIQDLSPDEIAQQMGCSTGALSMLLLRAKERLAELLREPEMALGNDGC